MDLYLKNRESKVGLRRAVKAMSRLLPEGHRMPSSDKILSYIERLAPKVSEEVHCFCKECVKYRDEATPEEMCSICHKNTELGQFYLFSIKVIVKYLFEHRNLASVLEDTVNRNSQDSINDISDGTVYKTLNSNRSRYDLTLIVGADGVRIRKGSKNELWVFLSTFVEIPIHLRESFITVLGLWYSEVKPNMNTFLRPFCIEVNSVGVTGIEWKHPHTGEICKTVVRIQVVVADAIARAIMQNTQQFNGKYGCNVCEVKTVKCAPQPEKKRIRVYPYEDNPKLRTAARMMNQARQAIETGRVVKGVKGPSALSIIPSLDISVCFVPEYMHCVLLGVTNQMIVLWTKKTGLWNISDHIFQIDVALKNICHQDFVHRAFAFEGMNGIIAKATHGTHNVG
ncbi:hypothetical protein ONE63_011584 [Megalurothrips usitatus]|uniref:Uncharacterized protein n=1 Tax=Megalurothrips usitatus TaxID=439358 RepID=A0AAV7X224_9NEOP|nr:hypothetical protein ONE63_011584 [Megalurothrips usitatus]